MSSDVDELTKQRRKILEACSGEDEQLVASLLDKQNADWSMLSIACSTGSVGVLGVVLSHIPELDKLWLAEEGLKHSNQWWDPSIRPHPIWTACSVGRVDAVKLILAADSTARASILQALEIACRRDYAAVVDALLGFFPPALPSDFNDTILPLMPTVCMRKMSAVLSTLIKHKALDIQAANDPDPEPTIRNLSETLGAMGLDIGMPVKPYKEPPPMKDMILLACKHGFAEGVKIMIEAGALIAPGTERDRQVTAMIGAEPLRILLSKQSKAFSVPTTAMPIAVSPSPRTISPMTEQVSDFSVEQLSSWLSSKYPKLKECCAVLVKEQVDGSAFLALNEADLKELGFAMGPRKNMLAVIEEIKRG